MTKLPVTRGRAVVHVESQNEREALIDHFKGRPLLGPCPPAFRVPIYLTGYIAKERTTGGNKDFIGDGEHNGFDVVIENVQTAVSGKEDTLEAFDVLIERTAKSYEGTARNNDIAPIFRVLADRFHTLLVRVKMGREDKIKAAWDEAWKMRGLGLDKQERRRDVEFERWMGKENG